MFYERCLRINGRPDNHVGGAPKSGVVGLLLAAQKQRQPVSAPTQKPSILSCHFSHNLFDFNVYCDSIHVFCHVSYI